MEGRTETIEQNADEQVGQHDLMRVLGELLAAVADVLEGQAILRRRGPIRLRRLISVLLTFVVLVTTDAVRSLAIARQQLRSLIGSLQLRNLYHPPQGWAAP